MTVPSWAPHDERKPVTAMVAASERSTTTEANLPQEDSAKFEQAPDRAPHDVRLFYREYRDIFRTVVKGVAIGDLIDPEGEADPDTIRLDLRPSQGDQRGRNKGGLFRCKVRF